MAQEENKYVAVIGAGIVGICCSIELKQRGFSVTLIDNNPPCTVTSRGNAGSIATAEVLPLASPGILVKAPKWLLDPLGPLSVRVSHLPFLLPWLLRFAKASSKSQVRYSAAAQAALMKLSAAAWPLLSKTAGIEHMLRKPGEIHVYESAHTFNAARWGWELRREMGVEFSYVSGADLYALEPELGPVITHGVHIPDWIMTTDPYEIGVALADYAFSRSVQYLDEKVDTIQGDSDSGVLVRTGKTENGRRFDSLVIAAGAWSHQLARPFDRGIPLQAERGYNTTIADPDIQLRQPITFADHGFVASPLTSGLRIGGAAELGGLESPPNFKRSDAMLIKAKRFLPNLTSTEGVQWMGNRPSLPDSLPVISRSSGHPDVFYAFGHGHLGLTQAPATAQLIADLICNRTPPIDLSPFRVSRF